MNNALAEDSSGKLKLDHNDRFFCFLPLAHILEFVYELCAIHWGGTIGYGSPRTLTSDSVRNSKGDIQEFQPTILVAYLSIYYKNKLTKGFLWCGKRLRNQLIPGWHPKALSFEDCSGLVSISSPK